MVRLFLWRVVAFRGWAGCERAMRSTAWPWWEMYEVEVGKERKSARKRCWDEVRMKRSEATGECIKVVVMGTENKG
jgi:hypothetical protein